MAINTQRLDRFISEHCQVNRKAVRLMLAQKRIVVDGLIASDTSLIIDKFSCVVFDGNVLQSNKPLYVMLNKPVGVVCATKDNKHKTVIDLLEGQYTSAALMDLHIVGRLDLNTSGLVLLTNDSRWSERLTSPEHKVDKCYRVILEKPLSEAYIQAFTKGMYFSYEDITTQPAKLTILSTFQAEVILIEGRYHQIKRMFGRFRNQVIGLHRSSIGLLKLDAELAAGDSRTLTKEEVAAALGKSQTKVGCFLF